MRGAAILLPALLWALPWALLGAVPAARAAAPAAVEAAHGMVTSAQHLASEAGVAVLQAGGNAIDAAVAVGYAEAVVNPCCGNIGGGGFMVLRMADGRASFLNFRETAPAAASAGMYLDAAGRVVPQASLFGWRAAGVPGTVAGLDAALTRYGRLSRAQVMAPAIRLAAEGFVLTRGDTDILAIGTRQFAADPTLARIFLRPDGQPFQPGERLVQRDLAATLRAIAADGPDAFYRGGFARALAGAAQGALTVADLAAYRTTESPPVACDYRGASILSAAPPSSGGVTLCEILDILSGYDLRALGFHSAASVHLLTEAMRHAFLDRNTALGDPAFVANPLQRLLSPGYAAAIRAKIGPRATPSQDLGAATPPHEQAETTSYAVVDAEGDAVAVTYTLNGAFGAAAMPPGTGVLMNDEMDDFTVAPGTANLFGLVQGPRNAIAPGKRPLSSMAPTIVLQDGQVALVLGSPGGSRIISIVLETILNMLDYGMAPQEAVDAPRLHHQWLPDTLYAEPFALSPDTAALLAGMGYAITEQVPWGDAEMIARAVRPAAGAVASSGNDAARSGGMRPGLWYGAHDSRRPAGAAIGY